MRRLALAALLLAVIALGVSAGPAAAASGGRWHPRPTRTAWQWQLQGSLDRSPAASVFDIDGFESSATDVAALHRQGAKVICYLDVGSWEEYRPDASQFPKSALGAVYEGYPEERWLDIAHYGQFAAIMKARIAMCARKGFDAVEPDNIAGYENKSGFDLTAADQLRFNRWIARQVHRAGMSVALKNDPKQAAALVGLYDFAIVEQCFQYEECGYYKTFVSHGKAVYEAEYELEPSEFCAAAEALDFSAVRKGVELFAKPFEPCDPLKEE
jgi:hypothetical protein